jgi:hypothetical protein
MNNAALIHPHRLFLLALALVLQALCSCSHQHKNDEIEAAMQQYNRLIKKQAADSIALLFTPDGELGEQAKGRSSIKKFLSGFSNVRVLLQTSTTDTIGITGDSALQKGYYYQVDIVTPPDTLKLKGAFTVHWRWNDNTGWLIKRIDTQPMN